MLSLINVTQHTKLGILKLYFLSLSISSTSSTFLSVVVVNKRGGYLPSAGRIGCETMDGQRLNWRIR